MERRPLTEFELRLLAELREVVAEQAEAASPRRPRRGRLVLAAAAAGVALAAGLALIPGGTASPAYAVEKAADGLVTVTIHRLDDAAGLENQLRANGVRAEVVYTPAGKYCELPWFTTADSVPPVEVDATGSGASFRLRPRDLTAGQTLVVQNSVAVSSDSASSVPAIFVSVSAGPVPPCRLVDLPPKGGPVPDGTGFSEVKHP